MKWNVAICSLRTDGRVNYGIKSPILKRDWAWR